MITWDEINDSKELTYYIRTGRRFTPFSSEPQNILDSYSAYVAAIGWYKKYLKSRYLLKRTRLYYNMRTRRGEDKHDRTFGWRD